MTGMAYVISTRHGSENTVAERIKKAARQCCKEIVSAIPFLPGYVRIEIVAGEDSQIKTANLDMPKGAKMVIKMVPGVIEVCGNGKEAVPLN
jgi:transcription antitermination factor NusG